MPTVSNTSPISNLAIIGRLTLLQNQFREVVLRAKKSGDVGAVRPEMDALKTKAHFFIARSLEIAILKEAKE